MWRKSLGAVWREWGLPRGACSFRCDLTLFKEHLATASFESGKYSLVPFVALTEWPP
jgi:hypothetical protein